MNTFPLSVRRCANLNLRQRFMSFADTITIFLASVDKISRRLHWSKFTCLPRCFGELVSIGPVGKIRSTYPNTRSYAQHSQIPRPSRSTGRAYHCPNDGDGIGNEVLRKSQYGGRTFIS